MKLRTASKAALRGLYAMAPELLRDAAGLAGAGLVSHGAWAIYPPAGWIAAGGFLLAGAWLSARGG